MKHIMGDPVFTLFQVAIQMTFFGFVFLLIFLKCCT